MIYLIDFENVHEEGFSALGRLGDKDAVYCFFTKNVAKISMSALAGMRSGQLHFIEAESGKQSLDLALVSYLGYLIGTRPQELYYDIVSNDNGFAKVAEFWNRRGNGLRVRVRKTNDLKPNPARRAPVQQVQPVTKPVEQPNPAEEPDTTVVVTAAPVEVSEQPAETPRQESQRPKQSRQRGQRQRSQRQRAARQEQAKNESAPAPAEEAKAVPVEEPKAAPAGEPVEEKTPAPQPTVEAPKTEPAPAPAAQTDGIPAEAEEFIRTQAEKFREDKNMKQLVYRAVVKKFGQKNGTQIYNNAKKLLLK